MRYIKGKNYQVTETEIFDLPFLLPADFSVCGSMVFSLTHSGRSELLVLKGWTWDGASFFLFRWLGTPQRWLTPSLYHDALYAAIRKGKIGREYREQIDLMFRDGLLERGVSRWIAQIAYWCVRIGGNFAVRKDVVEREVL